MGRLDIVHLKVRRANVDLLALYKEIQGFQKGHAHSAVGEVDDETGDAVVRFVATDMPQPDPMWAVRIGESVHNLRSALEQTIWQLVEHKGSKRPREHVTGFPTCLNETGRGSWAHDGLDKINGVGAKGEASIKTMQPFYGAKNMRDRKLHKLWVLNELWNWDKHRLPLFAQTFKQSAAPVRFVDGEGYVTEPELLPPFARLENGTIVARWKWAPGIPADAKVSVYFEVATSVLFDNTVAAVAGQEVTTVLFAIGETVAADINQLGALFI